MRTRRRPAGRLGGRAYMLLVLGRKCPNAAAEWGWQYVFPADRARTLRTRGSQHDDDLHPRFEPGWTCRLQPRGSPVTVIC